MKKNLKNSIKDGEMARNTEWGAPESAHDVYELTNPSSAASYRKRWGNLFVKECRQAAKAKENDEIEVETIEDFCDKHCIDRDTLLQWAKKDPEFAKAYRIGTMFLANKDFKGAKKKSYDSNLLARHLHTLDEKWKEIDRYHAMLKAEVAQRIAGFDGDSSGFTYKGPLLQEEPTDGSGSEDNTK